MNFSPRQFCNLEILGVLNTTFSLISRNIGGAIAPPVPPALLEKCRILVTAMLAAYAKGDAHDLQPLDDFSFLIAYLISPGFSSQACHLNYSTLPDKCTYLTYQMFP